MNSYRKIPFLTFVISPYRKVKINLSGCNFDCKGCFAIAKYETGPALSVKQLIELVIKSCGVIYGGIVRDIQVTGGEPIISRDYIISLVEEFKKLSIGNIGISTNGYLLNEELIKELKSLGVGYIKLDIKAYTERIHLDYTGMSNTPVLNAAKLLNKYNMNFYVRTIFSPHIIDFDEIEKIAEFLGNINKNIPYKIYQFAPEQLKDDISRKPTREQMQKAYSVAGKYLNNVEYYTTETAYKPAPYKYAEVRADELLEEFKKIDKISKTVIDDWNMEHFSMAHILNC